jgi:hypothetical protein
MNSRRDFIGLALSASGLTAISGMRPLLSSIAGKLKLEPPITSADAPGIEPWKQEAQYFKSNYLQALFLLKNHARIIDAPQTVDAFPSIRFGYLFLHPFGLFNVLNNLTADQFVDVHVSGTVDNNFVRFPNKEIIIIQTTLLDPGKALPCYQAGPFVDEAAYEKQLFVEAQEFSERLKSSVVAEAGGASVA